MGVEGVNCVVTGGSGLTGRRLVEMLVERGASRVVSFDITAKPSDALEHSAIEYMQVIHLILSAMARPLLQWYRKHVTSHAWMALCFSQSNFDICKASGIGAVGYYMGGVCVFYRHTRYQLHYTMLHT